MKRFKDLFKIESQTAACFDKGDFAEVNPVVERALRDVKTAGKFVDVDEF